VHVASVESSVTELLKGAVFVSVVIAIVEVSAVVVVAVVEVSAVVVVLVVEVSAVSVVVVVELSAVVVVLVVEVSAVVLVLVVEVSAVVVVVVIVSVEGGRIVSANEANDACFLHSACGTAPSPSQNAHSRCNASRVCMLLALLVVLLLPLVLLVLLLLSRLCPCSRRSVRWGGVNVATTLVSPPFG
jgi:hypothetical protein